MSTKELNSDLNKKNAPFFEAVAVEGKGVEATFKEATTILNKSISEKYKLEVKTSVEAVSSPSEIFFPKPPSKTLKPVALPPSLEPQVEAEQPPKPPVAEKIIQQPVNIELSELVSAIGELKEVMSEISNSLKEMQKKQTKISNELYEIRHIFSEVSGKRRFKRMFK